MLIGVVLGILAILGYIYWKKLEQHKNYWYERGIPNTTWSVDDNKWGKVSPHQISLDLYNQFKGVPFFGAWRFAGVRNQPTLVIRNDFDLIKSIWIKDFDHFSMAHGLVPMYKAWWPATRHEKLILNNLQTASGDEWKNIR